MPRFMKDRLYWRILIIVAITVGRYIKLLSQLVSIKFFESKISNFRSMIYWFETCNEWNPTPEREREYPTLAETETDGPHKPNLQFGQRKLAVTLLEIIVSIWDECGGVKVRQGFGKGVNVGNEPWGCLGICVEGCDSACNSARVF